MGTHADKIFINGIENLLYNIETRMLMQTYSGYHTFVQSN